MSDRKVRLAVRLDDEQHAIIEKLADHMHMTRTAVLRKLALDEAARLGIHADV